MESNIRELFMKTLDTNTNVRKGAERQLKVIEKDPNTLISIYQHLANDSSSIVRKTSLVFLADKFGELYKEESMKGFISHMKNQLFQIFVNAKDDMQLSFAKKLAEGFYDNGDEEEIFDLIRIAGKNINMADDMSTAGLEIIGEVFASDRFRYNLTGLLKVIYNENGIAFMDCLTNALQNKNYYRLKKYFKVLSKSFESFAALPMFLNNVEIFTQLGNVASGVISIGDIERPHYKVAVRWAYKFLYKTFVKGTGKSYNKSEIAKVVKSENYLVKLFEVFGNAVNEYTKGVKHDYHVYAHTANFFNHVYSKSIFPHLTCQYVDPIFINFVVTGLRYNEEVDEIFEMDPKRYLDIRYSYEDDTIKYSLVGLYSSLIGSSKEAKERILSYIVGNLSSNEYDPHLKYGLLELLTSTMEADLQGKFTGEDYKNFVSNLIISLLKSEQIYLISQLFYFLAISGGVVIDNETSINAMQTIYGYLEHENDAIKIEACLAFNFFFPNEALYPSLENVVPTLLSKILEFNKTYYLDTLSMFMGTIVDVFPNCVSNFTLEFVHSIVNNINDILTDDTNHFAIVEYFNVIENLINTNSNKKEVVQKVYEKCLPPMQVIIHRGVYDILEDTVNLLNTFFFILETIDPVSDEMFKKIIHMDIDELLLLSDVLSTFIDNYVSFVHDSQITPETMARIQFIVKSLLLSSYDEIDEFGFTPVCEIINSFLSYKGNLIREKYPGFIDFVVVEIHTLMPLLECSLDSLIAFGLLCIMNCFIAAPAITLNSLSQSSYNDFFTDVVIKNKEKFITVLDKKTMIYFLGTIMQSNIEVDVKDFNDLLVEVVAALPGAIKTRNMLIDKENERSATDDENNLTFNESDEDLFMSENIYSDLPLYKMDSFEYLKKLMAAPIPGSFGEKAVYSLKPYQVEELTRCFNEKLPEQKFLQ